MREKNTVSEKLLNSGVGFTHKNGGASLKLVRN